MTKWKITAPKGQHLKSVQIPMIDGIRSIKMIETDTACVGYVESDEVAQYLKDSSSNQFVIEEVTA